MRRGRKVEVVLNDAGLPWAVSLGADFCAEHEWGIKTIVSRFGLTGEPGILGRTNTRVPDEFGLASTFVPKSSRHRKCTEEESVLYFSRAFAEMQPGQWIDDVLGRRAELTLYEAFRDEPAQTEVGAWSERDFALRVRSNPELTAFSQDLYEAATKNELVIWLGGGGVFQNAGLCLGISSRAPQKWVDETLAGDLNRIKLMEADAATGIKDFLKQAGDAAPKTGWTRPFSYFALSPRWAVGEIAQRTAYPVVYWLNPCDQANNNFAWVTVEDLMAWTEGRGPIPKNPTK